MAEGFWLTELGIQLRIADFAQLVVVNTYNRALQMYAKDAGVKMFRYTISREDILRVCQICRPLEGETFRPGQFMYKLPQHPNCRCWYDVLVEAS